MAFLELAVGRSRKVIQCPYSFFLRGGGGADLKSSQVLKIALGNWATHVYDTLDPWKSGHRVQTHSSYTCNAEALSSAAGNCHAMMASPIWRYEDSQMWVVRPISVGGKMMVCKWGDVACKISGRRRNVTPYTLRHPIQLTGHRHPSTWSGASSREPPPPPPFQYIPGCGSATTHKVP